MGGELGDRGQRTGDADVQCDSTYSFMPFEHFYSLKDEIITNLASVSDMSTKMETYYLKKYNFDVYESAIKDEIKESNEDYFG